MTKDFRLTSLLKKVKNIKLYELSGRTGFICCFGHGFAVTMTFARISNIESNSTVNPAW